MIGPLVAAVEGMAAVGAAVAAPAAVGAETAAASAVGAGLGAGAAGAVGTGVAAEGAMLGAGAATGAGVAAETGAVAGVEAATESAAVAAHEASEAARTAERAIAQISEVLEARADSHGLLENLAHRTEDTPLAANPTEALGDVAAPLEGAPDGAVPPAPEAQILPEPQRIETSVNRDLQQWDRDNQIPDKSQDPRAFNKWVNDRAEAEKGFQMDAEVNEALNQWEAENPMPDQAKEPEKFDQWVKDRSQKESELRNPPGEEKTPQPEQKKQEEEDEKEEDEKEKKKEMSDWEIAMKIKRLHDLAERKVEVSRGLKILRRKLIKSDEDKLKIADYQVKVMITEDEMRIITEELADEMKRSSPGRAAMIATAMVGATLMTTTSDFVTQAADNSKGEVNQAQARRN